MTKILSAGALALGVAAALSGCGGVTPTERSRSEFREGRQFERQLKTYHVVYSPHRGKVGFMKVYDVRDAGGPPYEWKFVYDLDLNEVGRIDQFGHAVWERPYTPSEASYQRYSVRSVDLPVDTIERNVMRMLGIDPATDDVTFPLASNADIAGK
jgi:hypothetical protein